MDSSQLIHDFLLIFLGLGLILGRIVVTLLPSPIYSAFSLRLSSTFVAATKLHIFVGAMNVLIIFAMMFMNGSEYYKEFLLWNVTTIAEISQYGIIWATRSNKILEQDLISNNQQIGIHLSTDFFYSFWTHFNNLLVALRWPIAVARQQ
ncbi:hypothetical protein NMG60_11017103 [Bertholletia excelsa]